MDWVLWILAAVAFFMAWSASRKAAKLSDSFDTVQRDAAIGRGDVEELKQGLDGLRKLTAQMAGGHPVDAAMVKENRLFRSVPMLTVQKAVEAGESPFVLDVRSDQEWASGHIASAIHITLDGLKDRLHEVPRDGRPMYITCAGGQRSAAAAEFLSNRGFLEVYNVDGGMNSWQGERVSGA